jgi:hypothetical protein
MTATTIQVHLPSFSHTFNVSVTSGSTIIDLKHEIFRTCIGSPNVAGQRVIYKGRVLDDKEIVGHVWKVCILWQVLSRQLPHQTGRLMSPVYVTLPYTHQPGPLLLQTVPPLPILHPHHSHSQRRVPHLKLGLPR